MNLPWYEMLKPINEEAYYGISTTSNQELQDFNEFRVCMKKATELANKYKW